MRSRHASDTTAGLLLGLAATMTLATQLSPGVVRAVVVLPIAFLLPGYATVAALFGIRGRDRALDLSMAAMVSIAFYALAAIVFYALSVELSALSLAVSIDLVVLAAVLILFVRLRQLDQISERSALSPPGREYVPAVALLALLVLAIPAFIAVVRLFPSPSPAPFTEFAVAGGSSRLTGAPRVGATRQFRVELTVRNETGHPETYRIVPRVEGGRRWASREVPLASSASWSGSVSGPVRRRPCSQRLMIALEAITSARRITQLAVPLRGATSACQARVE